MSTNCLECNGRGETNDGDGSSPCQRCSPGGGWRKVVTPTVMSGRVVRWQRGRDEEISASRDAVHVEFKSQGDLDVSKAVEVIRMAQEESRSMASTDRSARYQS